MTAAQDARAVEALRCIQWLRASSRDMMTEGDPGGAAEAARIAVRVANVFGSRGLVVTAASRMLEHDEIEAPRVHRVTYAGPTGEWDDEP